MSNHDPRDLNPAELVLPDPTFAKLRNLAAAAAVIGAVLSGIAFSSDKKSFFFSYLFAFMFWLTLALGGLFFILLQHLTRSGWSVTVRRSAEALASTLVAFPIFFAPIVLGMHDLFPWTHEGHVSASKASFLNPSAFLIRAGVYFVVWIWVSRRMLGFSYAQDKSGDAALTGRSQRFAPGATLLFALTLSLAAVDWMMSLDPHWFSTMFGVYYFCSCAVSVFAVMALMAIGLRALPALHDVISTERLHDLGKFLFGFTIFWAYIAFCQFMLIWYANIPEETEFFLHRFHHGWEYVSASLPIAHFGLAFLILLPRASKRVPSILAFGSLFQLFFVAVDIFWLVIPNRGEAFSVTLGDGGALLLVGGAFWLVALKKLKGEALVPHKDPRLQESLVLSS